MIVIKVHGFANGEPCPHAGEFLKSFDHEADDGRGYGEFTPNLAEAMRFGTAGEAFAFWNRVPACRPMRPDGRPNKPLTAATCEIADVKAFADGGLPT